MTRREHWERIHSESPPENLSWYQARPTLSLELIRLTRVPLDGRILDVGGGASTLVDHLLDRGYSRVSVLDVAEPALGTAKRRLGPRESQVEWLVADVTTFDSPHPWDVWHDRAVFHFLTSEEEIAAYKACLVNAVPVDRHVLIATFSTRGPPQCSGLDVARYDPGSLHAKFGDDLDLLESREETHRTPSGIDQEFIFCRFKRI